MNPFKRIRDFFRKPAMIGAPPCLRPMWHDSATHARDFAERYAHDLDLAVAERMTELGIPDHQIGMPDDQRGIPWAAFHPLGGEGGYNSPDGRLVVESGLFNFGLFRKAYGEKAGKMFADSDVTSRLDAIIAHEYEECRHRGSHVETLKHAPVTELPITDRARQIATAMERGWSR